MEPALAPQQPVNFPILGLNPFKTSYATLYKSLESTKSRLLLCTAIILSLAAGAPLPIIGLLFGKIIDEFPPPEDELRTRLGQLMATACAYFAITWGWSVCWSIIGETISRELRERSLERLLGMDQAFFDIHQPDVTGIVTEKVQTVQLGTSEKVGLFLQSISYFLAAFGVGFYLHAKLTGILLATVIPAMTIIIFFGSALTSQFSKRAASCSEEAAALAEDAISGVKTVQATGAFDALCDNYRKILNAKLHWGLRKSMSGAVMLGCVYFVAYAANGLAFYVGSKEINNQGGNGAGTIYAVVFLILDASFVVGQFGPFIQTFALAASAGASIFGLLERNSPQINVYASHGRTVSRNLFKSPIEFKDLNFVYPSRPTCRALDCFSLNLEPGIMTGIVGASGSGKSTLTQLLLRFYDPSSGQIMLAGHNLREYNVASLRSHISLVGQDPVLFAGTILDNIRHGLSEHHRLTEVELLQKCKQAASDAGCDEFITALPEGMNTGIGSANFSQLSGGQKQRVALARALVSDPALLILDEYTSAMDAKSEAMVLQSLLRRSRNRTILVIAHRLATVRDCSRIVVMSQGRIVESGTHDELVRHGGAYRCLVDAQTLDSTDSSSNSSGECTETVADSPASTRSSVSSANSHSAEDLPALQSQEKLGILCVMSRVFRLNRDKNLYTATGLLASAISGATLIGEAVIFGNLINILNNTGPSMSQASFFCLMFFVVSLIALLAYSTSGVAFGIVSEWLVLKVQEQSLRTILRQDVNWFSSPRRSPHHLVASIGADSGRLSGLSGVILGTVVSALTSVFGGIVLAHVVAWKIAIVLLACVPVMLLSGFLRLRMLAKAEQRHHTAYNDAAALASEACSAIRTVAALGKERYFLRAYQESLDKPYKQGVKFALLGNILLAFSLSITYFIYALAYWWGSRLVGDGEYSILEFFIVLPALLFSAQAAGIMFSLGPELTQASSAAQRSLQLLDEKPSIMPTQFDPTTPSGHSYISTIADLSEKVDKPPDGTHIELRDVSLSYPTRAGVLALNQLDLSIGGEQFVAFIGQSGGGKSSVISLIERFYDPTAGAVLVNGINIRTLLVEDHRSRIALVPQDAELFPGSIAFNISIGARRDQRPAHEDIIDVCKKCGLHDFVMSLPEGYNTPCGKKGSALSGGQKQRIALARALIRDPEILLLDEATSQLDAQSELDVRRAIIEACKGRTVVMVAHRLASIQYADKICVFEHGRIIETGSHFELCRSGGVYASMVKMQHLG
ncbi:P-loop containing nucleoside triphosphate hydrolase protein [Rhizodiscina lignyota]|uniref:P-loop containing nucleoside triphosphate hydrolase protein n=1 Tax=Rhizodiscina lignyota TaxID=1504668 RepID=A0A9P4M7C0_9PEZI|nr:P-loop containing nucleoside triphosphate hydrolase protein [Rhizodiscina lignyota]